MNFTRGTYNVLRSVVVTTLALLVSLSAFAYLILLMPPIQEKLLHQGEKALSEYLNTSVSIGSVSITPFNQAEINDVLINDQQGDSLITIDKLGAGISLKDLITNRRVVITHAELIGLNGHVTRPDKDSPTNMQFIIDAFKPKDDKPPKPFDVQIKTVVVRRSSLTYDVLNQPQRLGRFDPNHLAVNNLRADLTLPQLKNNDFDIRVKRLSFDEASGLSLLRLATDLHITDNALDVKGLNVKLPGSDIRLDDIHLDYSSLKNLGKELADMPLRVSTPGSTITPADLSPLLPQLKSFTDPMSVVTTVERNGDRITFPTLSLRSRDGSMALNTSGTLTMPAMGSGYKSLDLERLNLTANAGQLARITQLIPSMPAATRDLISRCGELRVNGALHSINNHVDFDGMIGTSLGEVQLDGAMAQLPGGARFNGHVKTDALNLGNIIGKKDLLGQVAVDAQIDATVQGDDVSGHLQGHIPFVDFKGTRYHDITANVDKKGNDIKGEMEMNDPSGHVNIDGYAFFNGPNSTYDLNIVTRDLNMARLGLTDKYPDHRLSTTMTASFWGNSLDNATGYVQLDDVDFTDRNGKGLRIKNLQLSADDNGEDKLISISSDHINGYIEGQYDFKTIVPAVKHVLSRAFPQYLGDYAAYTHSGEPTQLNFDFVITPDDELNETLKLPVSLIYRTTLKGSLNEEDNSFDLTLDAPYILQGNKIIEGTRLNAALDSISGMVVLNMQSLYPMKNGKMALNIDANGQNNRLDANVGWRVQREADFHGNISLSALLDRSEEGKFKADVDVLPSQMVFNDTIWMVEKGHISVNDGMVVVENLAGGHDEQFIRINGKASKNPDDVLCLELSDVSLDYVFGTLAIDHVDFGGRATSKVYASDLFSKSPRLHSPSLYIKDITYNGALMGDLDIEVNYDNDTQGIMVNGDITQRNGRTSTLDGGIYVSDDSLYIEFDTDHANVAFLKPYMAAFTGDVQGEMSGKATLFGNFHTINLEGDLMVDTLRFLVDYVNCYYTASNAPIHIIPDYIEIDNIPIHDRDGHEAKFNGWLKHDAFHRPEFNFAITGANDFLAYDTNPAINPYWYGTIYGNGACFVEGGPGIVQIKVNMTSAPRSKFTFVMSDDEQADNYTFITFRDRDKPQKPDIEQQPDTLDLILSQLQHKVNQEEMAEPSAYFIDLQGDITPDLALTVVMDPVGGDRIKATGNGHMRLTYNNNGELETYGKYTLDKGTYNFTLQDVIIKDFTIRDGSSISFHGDPYAASLDLEALYSLNANITDLDKSFEQDEDLKRKNVPVHALLRAKGIISQPEISFDLEFPSLTTEADRKIKSIISTDDMMNRQIIYLLALNRFYTPEYMGTSSTQNEFITSVASSTIAGQLSNILGKMTDNLSIAPNVRTDRGDFSDVEVDVALSSQLLNNRLLLNGNFGYRDNTYNQSNTNFIGDFDLEYLLNSKGTFRLKAYNHFNDQNYYLRNALTTQGVGIVWKHDFDKPKSKKQKDGKSTAPHDSIPARNYSPAATADSSVRQPVNMITFRHTGHSDPDTN